MQSNGFQYQNTFQAPVGGHQQGEQKKYVQVTSTDVHEQSKQTGQWSGGCGSAAMSLDLVAELVRERGNEAVVMDFILYGLFSVFCSEQFHGSSNLCGHTYPPQDKLVYVLLMSGRWFLHGQHICRETFACGELSRHFIREILCGVLPLKCCRFVSYIKLSDKCFPCLNTWRVFLDHVLLFHCS